jgi:hypothetical protein
LFSVVTLDCRLGVELGHEDVVTDLTMTIVLLSNDDLASEELGSNPNVQVQELGPTILVPSQAIGNVVARTNDLLASHREWLNNLPQRAERGQAQNKARDVPASKHIPFEQSMEYYSGEYGCSTLSLLES